MVDPGGIAKQFRLLVVGIRWPPETFIDRLLSGLAASGFQVTFSSGRRPARGWLAERGLHWLPKQAVSSWLADYPCRAVLPRFDALYFPWNSAAMAHPRLFGRGLPVVVSCRGAQVNIAPHNPQRSGMRNGLKWTFREADAVHCVSEAILHEAMGYGLDPTKARVIHPAVDTRVFRPATDGPVGQDRARPGALRLVTTGAIIWRKGYEYLLLALRQALDAGQSVELALVGDGPERNRLLYAIDDLALRDAVRLMGKVRPEEVLRVLQYSDLFVLSSLSEGISNAVLEAMACGLPVVTTDSGGMNEAVTDGVEGLVVPVRDPVAMARALLRLARNPEERAAMGSAARARAERDFDLDAQIRRFRDLFLELSPALRAL